MFWQIIITIFTKNGDTKQHFKAKILKRRDVIAVECLAFHSYHITTRTHIHNNILTDQYNGFVTLKDFELPDDGFD